VNVKNGGSNEYKHHGVRQIDITPALYRGLGENADTSQTADAISDISINVLAGEVNLSV
jgi:hypothetical protein